MTAAVYRSGTPALSIPQSQNTAPVLEFNCLYTHDIRRKQKRWQDGFLRFHTFNKRIMVYDIPRNFIGDAHWKSGDTLQDGDELTLEKGGVMVQVQENIGTTETDLTELRQSKNKASSEHGSSSPIRPSRPPVLPHGAGATPAPALKHRSLNALLGTSRGPIGKASLPTKSPFEQRHLNFSGQVDDQNRPAKRRRLEQPLAQDSLPAFKPDVIQVEREEPLWARTSDASKSKEIIRPHGAERAPSKNTVIDLCDDADEEDKFLPGFSSDVLSPTSPNVAPMRSRNDEREQNSVRSSSPAFQTQRNIHDERTAARARSRFEAAREKENPQPTKAMSEKSHDRRKVKIPEDLSAEHDRALQQLPSHLPPDAPKASGVSASETATNATKTRPTLRIAASAPKKKMLVCQGQLSGVPPRSQHLRGEDAGPQKPAELPTSGSGISAKTQQEQLQERLANIEAKNKSRDSRPSSRKIKDRQQSAHPSRNNAVSTSPTNEQETPQLRPETPRQSHASELDQLDQMIMQPNAHPRSPLDKVDPPSKEPRDLRRVVSETNVPSASKPKRVPGAPVRYTPSPVKKPTSAKSSAGPSDLEASTTTRPPGPPPKSNPKRPIQKAVSLNITSNGTSTVMLSRPFQPPKPPSPKVVQAATEPEPWSREAFDLFTWRPPGWDEEGWCIKTDAAN